MVKKARNLNQHSFLILSRAQLKLRPNTSNITNSTRDTWEGALQTIIAIIIHKK